MKAAGYYRFTSYCCLCDKSFGLCGRGVLPAMKAIRTTREQREPDETIDNEQHSGYLPVHVARDSSWWQILYSISVAEGHDRSFISGKGR